MKKNAKMLTGLGLLACVMFAFAFANVPLYKMVCQRLGIGIAPNAKDIAQNKAGQIGRKINVRFSGLVGKGLTVSFQAGEALQKVEIGVEAQNKYIFTNLSDDTLRFRPVHSVIPEDAAKKINLTKCFCFDDQTLLPRQRLELPVIYTVGADLNSEIDYITMNYTLFPKHTDMQ